MDQETYGTLYEQAIDELIILAERAANTIAGPIPETDENIAQWNRVFHDTMDRLALMDGIRRQSWQA